MAHVVIVGPDHTIFSLGKRKTRSDEEPIDEIEEYLNARYLSAGEAAWRIMGFHITSKEPAVTSLPVHLPEYTGRRQYNRKDSSESRMSLLDRYFHRPAGSFMQQGIERHFKDLTYVEYFSLFRLAKYDPLNSAKSSYYMERPNTEQSPLKHVILRDEKNRHIARLQTVRPSAGDVFYLRTILHHIPLESFLDGLMVGNAIHNTYQEAASAHGLFDNEDEATQAMSEAIKNLRTPRQLRVLFVHLLVNEVIASPIQFWNLFNNKMKLDFQLAHNNSNELGTSYALHDIADMLREYGKELDDFGLPQVTQYRPEVAHELAKWSPVKDALTTRVTNAISAFNEGQRAIYYDIMDAVDADQQLLLFVEGKAGVGKTTLIKTICDSLRSMDQIVLPTATSGFAAQLYDAGRTMHSTFKVRWAPRTLAF